MLSLSTEAVTIATLSKFVPELKPFTDNATLCQRLKIEALYEAAALAQVEDVEEVRRDEALNIPRSIDYNCNSLNLSFEEREKLLMVQPPTVSYIFK